MNFSFLLPNLDACFVRLWATGRYGFSLPKKVEITTPTGETFTFLYYNRKVGLKSELTNRTLVRIAISQFLRGEGAHPDAVEIDDATQPFAGALTVIRQSSASTAPLRVKPGKSHARAAARAS
jgi:hypothetical protein